MNNYIPDIKSPVILMTDIGSDVDDALALLAILNSDINLRAIVTVNGNVNFRSMIAKEMVTLAGKNIDIVAGDSQPISDGVHPYSYFEHVHIPSTMIKFEPGEADPIYPSFKKLGIRSDAVTYLKEVLAKEPHVILSIGPLTTLAKLIKESPDSSVNILQVYVMGCRFGEVPTHEHNIRYDIAAAEIVFGSNIPLTVLPGSLCSKYYWPSPKTEQFSSKPGIYVKQMLGSFLASKTAQNYLRGLDDRDSRISTSDLVSKLLLESLNRIPSSERFSLNEKHRYLVCNLEDIEGAAFSGADYFKQYHELINALLDPKISTGFMRVMADWLKSIIPTTVSVADVYIPYALLNHQALQMSAGIVSVDLMGYTSFQESEGHHRVVKELPIDNFESFLNRILV